MPDRKELIDEYNRFYAGNERMWIDNDRNDFAFTSIGQYLNYQPKTVLDVGCGNGHTLKYFVERWPDTRFTGLDISPVALDIARREVPEADFVSGFLGDVSLSKHYCVLVMGVAEHFEDLQSGLTAVRDVTRKDGICYMEIPNCIGYQTSVKEEGYRRLNFGSRQYEWHLFRDTWNRELEAAGFRIANILHGINIFSEFCYILEVA